MGQEYFHQEGEVIKDRSFLGRLSAYDLHPDGKPYHTFRTYTVLADGRNSTFKNCYFENSAGSGETAGQAIALYLDGDNIHVTDCVLRGHQDTLFLAPLPLKERLVDGFLGPRQFYPRTNHTVYFKNCLIEGGIDFIFGGATAYFDNCEFKSVEPGYVFAPCTPENVKVGFVARNCRFTSAEDVPEGSCYIGRPWRIHGKVRIENCYLGAHINTAGWDDWGKPESHHTVEFIEIGSFGPGAHAEKRPDYVQVINKI